MAKVCGRCVWGIRHDDGPLCPATRAWLIAQGLQPELDTAERPDLRSPRLVPLRPRGE